MKAYLEPEEIAWLEKAAFSLRDKLLIRMLFHLGCCVSEPSTFTFEGVDFSDKSDYLSYLA